MTLPGDDHLDDLSYGRPARTTATEGVPGATLHAADAGRGRPLQEVDRCLALGTQTLEKLALLRAQRRAEPGFPAARQALVATRPGHSGEKLADGRVVRGHDALLCSSSRSGHAGHDEQAGQDKDEHAHLSHRQAGGGSIPPDRTKSLAPRALTPA